MPDSLFGWDLTFKSVEKDLNKKSDVLVSFAHFILAKRGFRCIGVGDDRTVVSGESTSELLPAGWNSRQQYSLRYMLNDKLYIFSALESDGNLIINLMKAEDLAVASLAFNIDNAVKEMTGSIDKLMPEYKDIMYKVKRDIVDAVCDKVTVTAETQTKAEPGRERHSPLRVEPRPRSGMRGPRGGLDSRPEASPLQIGRSDLDPFSAGGGMIFDPFSSRPGPVNPGLGVPGGLPRGAVPPGARFDPFGPPDFLSTAPRRQPPPDADDFMPPDNMFM